MRHLRIVVDYERVKVIRRVRFLDADRIDRTRMAEELEKLGHKVSRTNVARWILTGNVPEKHLPSIKKLDFDLIVTNRRR